MSNPGFESGFTGWTEIEPSAISGVAHSGSNSGKVAGSTGQVKQTVAGLAANTSYVLSAWVMGSARVGVRGHGGAEVSGSTSATSWTQVSVTFTTGASSTSAEIYAAWVSGGDARVDDFALAVSEGAPPPPPPPGTGCAYPAQKLDLTNWKVTLPIGASGSPTEVKQRELATYSIDPWFRVNSACSGVQFRAHTSGVTTKGSSYPRSELREMARNGTDEASWSTTSGTHRMLIDEAITAVPSGKKHVVAGQIHDAKDDVIVIRLEHPKLFVDINGTTGPTLDANYTLGKRFTVEFVAANGTIKVYYNGASTPAYTLRRSVSGCYFKAGAYTQSNCSTESTRGATCGADNYGEVQIYNLSVAHQ